ncbi:putative GMP synthase [Daphnia magna]|uniref:Putative GMP synthase n=1 Tax=Daphnia magna TaxID=35525 RepID=A0A164UZL3_9CRUS|nr:putative GMP synthase [Daphnia magna]
MASSRGLSIRIVCAEELFMEAGFGETQVLIRLMVDYTSMAAKEHALLNRIEIATSEEERVLLKELSSRNQYVATLLPICALGVQIQELRSLDVLLAEFYKDCSLPWREIAELKLAQMALVLIPFHFYHDSSQRIPSCQRSVVVRPFLSQDFLTGLHAIPDTHLPQEIVDRMVEAVLIVPGLVRVMYDRTAKPPGTTKWECFDLRTLLRQMIPSPLFHFWPNFKFCLKYMI